MYQNITFPSLLTTNMDKQKDRNNQRLYPVQVVATLKFIWNSKMKKKRRKGWVTHICSSSLCPSVNPKGSKLTQDQVFSITRSKTERAVRSTFGNNIEFNV